jgi:hypothetical protein
MPVFKGGIYLLFCYKEEKMKRFWLVLLSLGLVMAFSVSAFAVDVKVSGEYYAAGLYLNKINVADVPSSDVDTAFYFQRLRVGTDFIVSPCLKLVTRFDAMERIWGGARSASGTYDAQSAGTRSENENIAFDLAYIDYTSPIGLFRVGYQKDYEWGTIFDNRTTGPTAGMITYAVPVGPVTIIAQYAKERDNSASAVTPANGITDLDYDSYRLGAIFNFNAGQAKGEVGSLLLFNRDAENKANTTQVNPTPPPNVFIDSGYLTNVYKLIPYFKTQIGPVAFQGEFEYTFGNAVKMENSALGSHNADISAWSAFLDATVNLGPVYVGGSFVYLSGDDPGTDKLEGGVFHGVGVNTAGLDWNPCLIMFNTETTAYWVGNLGGYNGSLVDSEMSNAWFFQGRVGVKPVPKLDAMLSVSYAQADKKPASYAGDAYGWEIDATGTYKITNNLSYMLGIGYLFTGDYYKGSTAGADVNDNYMLINKLTLSF